MTSAMAGTIEARLSSRIGYPVFMTTVIPAASSTSSILVLYCPDFVIGDRQDLEIAASNVAGNSFAYNQTLIRAIMRVDFLLLRAASLEIITGVAH
jgi:HK97 family phage major capsid protein